MATTTHFDLNDDDNSNNDTIIDAETQSAPAQNAQGEQETIIDTGPLPTVQGKSRIGAWLNNVFGGVFTAADQQTIVDLAERRRRKSRYDQEPVKVTPEIEQLAINADMSVGELVTYLSRSIGNDQEVIDSFEDDTEHWSGTLVRNFFIVFFYVVPACIALIIGVAVGIDFAGGTVSLSAIPVILLCLLFEAIPIILMLATAKLLSRVMSGLKKSLPGALLIGLLFVMVALGSAAAQWILFQNADLTTLAAKIGAVVRVFALPTAEIASAIALPILRKKSLEDHLNVLKKKNDAKIAMNTQHINNELSTLNAAIQAKSTLQKEADYQKKQDLATKLIDILSEKVIKDAERSLDDRDNNGRSSRRDGSR